MSAVCRALLIPFVCWYDTSALSWRKKQKEEEEEEKSNAEFTFRKFNFCVTQFCSSASEIVNFAVSLIYCVLLFHHVTEVLCFAQTLGCCVTEVFHCVSKVMCFTVLRRRLPVEGKSLVHVDQTKSRHECPIQSLSRNSFDGEFSTMILRAADSQSRPTVLLSLVVFTEQRDAPSHIGQDDGRGEVC